MKKINSSGINFKNAQQLTREQMKKIMGGVIETTITKCSVFCGNVETTRICPRGVACVTNETQICCGDDCKNMCPAA